MTAPAAGSHAESSGRQVFVLDTSVLLADPRAITRFAEHEVVLPLVVITELEAKRNHPELGGPPARRCGRSRRSAPRPGR